MGLSSINPFDDPEIKKQILGDSGVKSFDNDYPIYDPEKNLGKIVGDDDLSSFENIISNAPTIPGSGTIKTIIRDASTLVKDKNESKVVELNNSLNDLFTDYNKQYGTNLQIDFNSLSNTLIAVSDPLQSRTLQLFLSKLYGNLKSILILQMISKLSLAIDSLLDTDKLLSDKELTYTDRFLAVQQILDFVEKLQTLAPDIVIQGADVELRRLGEQTKSQELQTQKDDTAVQDFMDLFKKENGIE